MTSPRSSGSTSVGVLGGADAATDALSPSRGLHVALSSSCDLRASTFSGVRRKIRRPAVVQSTSELRVINHSISCVALDLRYYLYFRSVDRELINLHRVSFIG
jgi:hypothetical protein